VDLINQIFGTILSAIQGTVTSLATFSLPILAFAALIMFYWQGGLELAMSQGGSLADALGGLLAKVLVIGIFYFVVVFWQPLTKAIVDTMLFWSGAPNAQAMLTQPGQVWEMGQQIANSLGRYDEFWREQAATWNFVVSPRDFLLFLATLLGFFVMTLHMGTIMIELTLAMALGTVLFPWSLIRPLGMLGEFAVGYFTGGCIRALVAALLIGIAFPVFQGLTPTLATSAAAATFVDPLSGVAFPTHAPPMTESVGMALGAILFAFLMVILPGRAARLASLPTMALTGSDLTSAAMTTARFGMMMTGMTTGVLRGTSRMMAGI